MAFDFQKAIKEAQENASLPLVSAIVLGSSGSGKSTLMGTFGVKTLYLYTTGEDHGVKSAKASKNSDLVPLCVDFSDGKKLDADVAYARLVEVLGSKEELKKLKIGAVAVDGASEIEGIIRQTTVWKKACLSTKGDHNAFAEPAATISLFRPVIALLKELQRALTVHFAVSCILDVKDMGASGEILEATPRLQGYSVAETIVQQFGDVLVVGRMEKNGEVKHKLQFMSEITKSSKDFKTLQIKKMINFSPRVAGVQDLPPILDADFKEIIKLKGAK